MITNTALSIRMCEKEFKWKAKNGHMRAIGAFLYSTLSPNFGSIKCPHEGHATGGKTKLRVRVDVPWRKRHEEWGSGGWPREGRPRKAGLKTIGGSFWKKQRFTEFVQPIRRGETRGAPPKSTRILVCRGGPHSRVFRLHIIFTFDPFIQI